MGAAYTFSTSLCRYARPGWGGRGKPRPEATRRLRAEARLAADHAPLAGIPGFGGLWRTYGQRASQIQDNAVSQKRPCGREGRSCGRGIPCFYRDLMIVNQI